MNDAFVTNTRQQVTIRPILFIFKILFFLVTPPFWPPFSVSVRLTAVVACRSTSAVLSWSEFDRVDDRRTVC